MSSHVPLPEAFSAIGWVASLMSTLLFIPQTMQAFVTKSTDDISTFTILALAIGNIFWIIYATSIDSWQIIFSSFMLVGLGFTIVFFKYREQIAHAFARLKHRKK